jgi:hypothetical protein
LDIGYYKVNVTSALHRYSLTGILTLLTPPDQGRLRLKILWPKEVLTAKISNLHEGPAKQMGGVDYRELILDYEHRVFPGETVDILGPDTTYQIEYEFDDAIYWSLINNPRDIHFTLFFEDHPPITGKKSFSDLNVY